MVHGGTDEKRPIQTGREDFNMIYTNSCLDVTIIWTWRKMTKMSYAEKKINLEMLKTSQ